MAWRNEQPLLVASRQFAGTAQNARTVVFVQPIDEHWSKQLEDKTYVVETNLYDVASEKLIWTGVSETLNPGSAVNGNSQFAENHRALRSLLRSDVADTSHRERALEGGCSI